MLANASVAGAAAPQDAENTLRRLQTFYDSHAFDTEGPYADIFAVLLSTSKHLIDVNLAQQERITTLERSLERLQQESAVVCNQSVKTLQHVRELQDEVSAAQRQLRTIAAADCERAMLDGIGKGEEGTRAARFAHGPGERTPPRPGSAGDARDMAAFERFAKRAGNRLQTLEENEKHVTNRLQWLGEQLSRVQTEQNSTGKRLDRVIHDVKGQNRGGSGRSGGAASPPRPLELLSEAVDIEEEDRLHLLRRRLVDVEEGQTALAQRVNKNIAAVEALSATTEADRQTLSGAVAGVREQLTEVRVGLERVKGQLATSRQPPQQQRQSETKEAVPADAPNAKHTIAFTEEDFLMPATSPDRRGSQPRSAATPHTQGMAAVAVERMWGDWLRILRAMRYAVSDVHRGGDGSGNTSGGGDALADGRLSHPAASAVAREGQVLLAQLLDVAAAMATTTHYSPLPSQHGEPSEVVGNDTVADKTMAALADRLETLCGRVEVLEVYAPHTYSIATRPPLLGLELIDDDDIKAKDARVASARVRGRELSHGTRQGAGHGMLRVKEVFTGFLADKAGVSPGDIILALDHTVVSNRAELYVALREKTRNHQVVCQQVLERNYFSEATGGRQAGPRSLPNMTLPLTVRRGSEVVEVELNVPASLVWPPQSPSG